MQTKPLHEDDNSLQANLTRRLIKASFMYYNGQDSGMSDIRFDKELEMLRQMELSSGFAYENSPTITVGAKTTSTLKEVKHEFTALSLDEVKYKEREKLVS